MCSMGSSRSKDAIRRCPSPRNSRNLGSSSEGLRLLIAFEIGVSTVSACSEALMVKILTAKYARPRAHKTNQVDEQESYPILCMTLYLPPLSSGESQWGSIRNPQMERDLEVPQA